MEYIFIIRIRHNKVRQRTIQCVPKVKEYKIQHINDIYMNTLQNAFTKFEIIVVKYLGASSRTSNFGTAAGLNSFLITFFSSFYYAI